MRTLYCWVLSKEVSSTILKPFYDATWDWTHVSQTIGEYSTHQTNELKKSKRISKKNTKISYKDWETDWF